MATNQSVQTPAALARMVDNVEIVLFYTPTLDNFLSVAEVRALKNLGPDEYVSFSVHLPVFLEIASPDRKKQEYSVPFKFRPKIAEYFDLSRQHDVRNTIGN